MNLPILFLKNTCLTFGGTPLFENIDLQISRGDRIALVGRNGSGKSSLLKVIAGIYESTKGDRYVAPKITISYLEQNNLNNINLNIYSYVLSDIAINDIDNNKYKADIILSKLGLNGNKEIKKLSGGQLRRTALAKALILESDILLLDEPTNHLDIKSIEWLENYITSYKGALICISHDRLFLKNISNKIMWLDRGNIKTLNKGFNFFENWAETVYEYEKQELQKLNKKLDAENLWLQQGVTARRKRNQGRLKELFSIRDKIKSDQSNFYKISNNVKLPDINSNIASKMILEINQVSYGYNDENNIISSFSLRILKGEKIAIIGQNGSGKTTLIRLITGDLKSKSGVIRLGRDIQISYFDQKRQFINNEQTILKIICPNGNDTVMINGQSKHVNSYMKDFLFEASQLNSPVSSLSGGQQSRLLLAKILINPGNLLILDEPTNDLDIETLDLLEEMLSNYKGTLIIVSHDREFLDRIVTRSLVFEENNRIVDFIGGYTDYTKLLKEKPIEKIEKNCKTTKEFIKSNSNKLSYKHVRELNLLPQIIKNLEDSIVLIESKISDPNLFTNDVTEFNRLTKELELKKAELKLSETRWLELDEMNEK